MTLNKPHSTMSDYLHQMYNLWGRHGFDGDYEIWGACSEYQ